jgi:hypothetical protein
MEALVDVRRSVTAAQASGQLTPSKANDLLDRLDELRQHLAQGSSADAGRRLRELDRQLRKALASGDLTPAGLQTIEGPLSTLRSVLPAQDSQD